MNNSRIASKITVWTVIRFHHAEEWTAILGRYPTLFGRPEAPVPQPGAESAEAVGFDPEDFDAPWRAVLGELAETDGVVVEPGEEVMAEGRVVDLDLATISKDGIALRLVDDQRATASEVAEALESQGLHVLRVSVSEKGLRGRILEALEGPASR